MIVVIIERTRMDANHLLFSKMIRVHPRHPVMDVHVLF